MQKLLLLALLINISCIPFKKSETKLIVGVPHVWGDLIPSLQHTAIGDAILVNQFESLVKIGQGGRIVPNAATSWTSSDNFKVFKFIIDKNKTYSNGKKLEPLDFKKAWEHSLELIPKSSNNSLQDVLSEVVGIEDYQKNKSISGIIADNNTLTIKFKRPLRTALTYLAGGRLASFVIDKGKYLGTGPYVLVDSNENEARFTRNQHYKLNNIFDTVIYKVTPLENAKKALEAGTIQLYLAGEKLILPNCSEPSAIVACTSGPPSRHLVVVVNGLDNRIFSNKKLRQALQFLFFKNLTKENLPEHLKENLTFDPQIFLPLQHGRLKEDIVKNKINEGSKYVDQLILESKNNPILIKTINTEKWLIDYFAKLGIVINKDSKPEDGKLLLELYYKKYNTDLMNFALGVSNGDPDGIYHALGKNGSIASPMTGRYKLWEKLEIGRNLVDESKLDAAYSDASLTALDEVPIIHLGYLNSKVIYRSDKVKLHSDYYERDDDRLTSFMPKQSFWGN